MIICDDKDCKEEAHWYKPEFSNVYSHRIIIEPGGSERWVPVKCILKRKGPPRDWLKDNDPIDIFDGNYRIVWNSEEDDDKIEYVDK